MAIPDFELLAKADADSSSGIRGRLRTVRRLVQRSFLDRDLRHQERFFCQNSGACGSHYIIDLLADNGIERVFHEKSPDLNELGVQHYDSPISNSRIIQALRYTRHNVYFEANNRLFSFSRELATAFPGASFIHLFRHPAKAVRSAMSKPNVEEYLRTNVRFQGTLAGEKDFSPLERFCHYWSNVNQRILSDLELLERSGTRAMWLNFDDMVSGSIDRLAEFMGCKLTVHKREASHVGAVRSVGKFENFESWSQKDRDALERICGPLHQRLCAKGEAELS